MCYLLPVPEAFRFDDFELLTTRRELRRNGVAQSIEPKVYDLLLYLIQNRERSVDKHELQEAIWPDVIVTEASLTRCIMKARKAVGDNARHQNTIKTVHSHGYRFHAQVDAEEGKSVATASQSTDQLSVAVLPFANLTSDPQNAYLADGLTQDIATDLSRNSWLFVISHATSRTYGGSAPDLGLVAQELGVRYVVQGSIRFAADRIRIAAALIQIESGRQEWSERFDRPLDEFFRIQDEIVAGIASSLGAHLRRAEGRQAKLADPATLDAWGLIHRGMAESWTRFDRKSNLKAEECYRKALAIAPENARAKAFLGCSVAMKVSNGWSSDIAADIALARSLGQSAIQLAPEDAMVLCQWGHTNSCLGTADEGIGVLERAIDLDPNNAYGLGMLAYGLTCVGRAEESIEMVNEALRLSPRDPATHWYLVMLSWAYLQLEQFDDCAREAQRSINSYSGWQPPRVTLAVARAALGQVDRARDCVAQALSLDRGSTAAGYQKFFGLVVRKPELMQRIGRWLEEIWPNPN